jgi:formate dehydrogenase maturation protein FdhE
VPGVDVQVVVPSTDSDGAHLPRAIRPRFLLKMSDAPMRKVLKGPSAERKEDLEKCLLAAVAARQMKLVTILDQIPQLKAQTPETKQKVDEWLLGDHLSESPIEALIEDLKNGEQDSMKAELEALRKQAQQEAQGLVALGVLRSKLNEQVGGEVVFLGQSLAK